MAVLTALAVLGGVILVVVLMMSSVVSLGKSLADVRAEDRALCAEPAADCVAHVPGTLLDDWSRSRRSDKWRIRIGAEEKTVVLTEQWAVTRIEGQEDIEVAVRGDRVLAVRELGGEWRQTSDTGWPAALAGIGVLVGAAAIALALLGALLRRWLGAAWSVLLTLLVAVAVSGFALWVAAGLFSAPPPWALAVAAGMFLVVIAGALGDRRSKRFADSGTVGAAP